MGKIIRRLKRIRPGKGSSSLAADWPALCRRLEEANLTAVAIVAREQEVLDRTAKLVKEARAVVKFQRLLKDEEDFKDLADLKEVDQVVLAVFDLSVFRLRHRLVQVLKASPGRTPEIISPAYAYDPLQEDEQFQAIITTLAEKTSWDIDFWRTWKSYGILQLLCMALPLAGDCVEFGCYHGYSAAFLAETIQALKISAKKITLFDTWEGMPTADPSADNLYRPGDFSYTSLGRVKQTHEPWVEFFEYVQGDICQTAPECEFGQLCYARIDVDLYEPAKVALETVYDRVCPGGIIYFDDYVSPSCLGERMAVDEFLAGRPERLFYMLGDRAYIIKGVG